MSTDNNLTSEEQTKWNTIKNDLDSYDEPMKELWFPRANGPSMNEFERVAIYLGAPHPDSSPEFKSGASIVVHDLGYLLRDLKKAEKNEDIHEQNDIKRKFLEMIENPLLRAQNYKKEIQGYNVGDQDRWAVITAGTSPSAIGASIARNHYYNQNFRYRNVTGRGTR